MSKNKFKKQIQEKYKGRGNTWVKIPKDSPAFQSFLNLVPDCNVGLSFLDHVNREGFGWARFSKVEGTESSPVELFEVLQTVGYLPPPGRRTFIGRKRSV